MPFSGKLVVLSYSSPQGTIIQSDPVGLLCCLVIDLILIITFYISKVMELKRVHRPLSDLAPMFLRKWFVSETSNGPSKEIAKANSLEPLVGSWRKGLGGANIGVDLRFDNLGLALPDGKVVLQGVSGEIKSSRMTAIMGPSGAGKTTFMHVLCGKVSRTGGKLFINNQEAEMPQYRNVIGYVPQEDIMLREMTVREIVLYSARTRLPRSWPDSEVQAFVEELLKALNLSHVAHSQIGDEIQRGVSGGQRKRVNIAMEMAAVPMCLFLDEPTSGLDSTAALSVADILKQVAELGLTIVSVIHQPRIEIFRKFDDVLMIAPGGRTAYLGPTVQARTYFEKLGYVFDPSANEADVLMDILSGKGKNSIQNYNPEHLVQLWSKHAEADKPQKVDIEKGNQSSSDFKTVMKKVVQERGANLFYQIILSHNRAFVQQLRAIPALVQETLVGILALTLGLAAGALMGIAAVGTPELFFTVWVSPYTAMSPAPLAWLISLYGLLIGISIAFASGPSGVKVFSEEKAVYWREAAVGHSKFGYYCGKTLSTVYRIGLSSLHFTAIYMWLANPIVTTDRFFYIIFMTFFGVYGMSSIIAMLVRRENAPLMSVIVSLFIAVFCGYGPSLKQATSWGVMFIWELSFNKWGAEALYSESTLPYLSVYEVESAAGAFGYTLDRYATDIGVMFLLGIIWRFIGFFLMVLTNRDKQK